MSPLRTLAVLAPILSLLACGEPAGPYETASIELRSSGGDEVVSEEGGGFGSASGPGLAAPAGNREAFQEALVQAQARREQEIAQVDTESPAHRRLHAELIAIRRKLANLDLSVLQQRNAFVLAQGAVNNFVYQYAPDREWEATYAIRAGDIGLASSIVQDVLVRFEASDAAPVAHVEVPQEASLEAETDAPIRDLATDRLKVETAGADALLRLAQLAVEAADFAEAERQLRACIGFESDLTVRADALNGYSTLLEVLGRDEEAREIDQISARTLNRAR